MFCIHFWSTFIIANSTISLFHEVRSVEVILYRANDSFQSFQILIDYPLYTTSSIESCFSPLTLLFHNCLNTSASTHHVLHSQVSPHLTATCAGPLPPSVGDYKQPVIAAPCYYVEFINKISKLALSVHSP